MTTTTLTPEQRAKEKAMALAAAKAGIHGSDQGPPPPGDPNAPLTLDDVLALLQQIIDEASGQPLTDAQVARYEELEGQLRAIQRSDQIMQRNAAYNTPTSNLAAAVHVGVIRHDDTLERAFDSYLRTGRENADLVELRAQGVAPDSAGGFTVPDTMRAVLIDRLKAFGGLASAVETITTAAGEPIRWPTLDDTGNTGVIAAEGTAPQSGGADLVFGESVLGAFKYVAPGASQLPLKVSVELLQDAAFDIAALVSRKLGERIGRLQAAHWVTGNGTTEPFGIDTGTAVGANTFDAAAPAYDELVSAVHQVDPAYRMNASWSFNDATMAMIEKVLDSNDRPLLAPAQQGISDSPSAANKTLLGYPIVIDQAWPTYTDGGTNKWGVFGDLRQGYVIRRVKDLTLIVNPYTYANEGQVCYVLWARADGVPQDTAAYRVLQNEAS